MTISMSSTMVMVLDGFSGGGAWCGVSRGCHGGADGGDGEYGPYGPGGEGTGEDVSSYKFDNYVLTPGAGGEWFNDAGFYAGGGGGGVMVRVLKLVNTKDRDMEVVEVYTQLTLEKVQNILERVFKVSLSLSLLNKVNRIHQIYF